MLGLKSIDYLRPKKKVYATIILRTLKVTLLGRLENFDEMERIDL